MTNQYNNTLINKFNDTVVKFTTVALLILMALVPFISSATEQTSCIQVTKTGKGPVVFLIPGFSNDSRVWAQTTQHLKASFEVHNISLAGFASNPACSKSTDIYNAAMTDIEKYAANQKLSNVTLIGHSMGGLLSMNMGIRNPNVFTKVLSVDGLPFIGSIFTQNNETQVADVALQAEQMQQFYANASPEVIADMTKRGLFVQTDNKDGQQQIVAMAQQSDPTTLGAAIKAVMTTDLRSTLHKYTGELLLIGASGGFTSEAQQQAIEQLYAEQVATAPNSQVKMNTKSKHFVMFDDVTWLNQTIQSFLTSNAIAITKS